VEERWVGSVLDRATWAREEGASDEGSLVPWQRSNLDRNTITRFLFVLCSR
jgi:hypothetical protein